MPDPTGTPAWIDVIAPEGAVDGPAVGLEPWIDVEAAEGVVVPHVVPVGPSIVRIRCPFPPRLVSHKAAPVAVAVGSPAEAEIAVPAGPVLVEDFRTVWIGVRTETLVAVAFTAT
jgi:hypothetical protein